MFKGTISDILSFCGGEESHNFLLGFPCQTNNSQPHGPWTEVLGIEMKADDAAIKKSRLETPRGFGGRIRAIAMSAH